MSLIVKIGADIRSFDREMRKLTKDISSITSKMQNQGQMMSQALTLPLAAVGGFAIKTGMEFEAAMSDVKAASGSSGKELQSLEDLARQLGSTTKYSGTEAAQGLTELLKAGQNTNQAMASIPGVLSLASAGSLEVADAAAITTSALAQFHLEAGEAGKVGDILAKTANVTKTSVEELGAALITAGPAGANAHMAFSEVNAMLGIFAEKGVSGALAGEKVKQVINRLANASGPGAEALALLGVSVYDSEGNMRSMIDVIGDLEKVTGDMTEESRNHYLSTIFGADAVAAANTLIEKGADGIREFSGELADSKGYADEFAKTLNDNFKGKLEAMMGDLEEVGITIFQALLPALNKLIEGISKVAEWFAKLSPQAQTFIIVMAGILAVAGPLLVMIAMLVNAFAIIKASLVAVKFATLGAIGLWVLLAVAIAVLVALIIIYWDDIVKFTKKAWGAIKDFMIDLWETVSSKASEIWDGLSSYFSDLWSGIKSKTETAWNAIKDFFAEWGLTIIAVMTGPIGWLVGLIVANWDAIKAATLSVWNAIKDYLTGVWESIVSFVSPIFGSIVSVLTAIWNGISTATKAVWNFIIQYLKAIWTALLYFAMPVFEKVKKFVMDVWNSIKNTTASVWKSIKSTVTSVWNGIKTSAISVWNSLKTFFVTWLNFVKGVYSTIWKAIKNAVVTIWNSIKSTAVSVWNSIKNAVMGPINKLKSNAIQAFNALKSGVSNVFQGIKSTAISIWNTIYSNITSKVSALSGAVSGAFSGMKDRILGVWEGIKGGLRFIVNGIVSMINRFIDGFNTPAKLLNKIPGVDAPTIPHVPMLATGGTIFGSGKAIVGEAGPELISKSGSQVKVTPLSAGEKAKGITGAAGGAGTVIQIQSMVVREEADIAKIATELNKIQNRTARASGRLAF